MKPSLLPHPQAQIDAFLVFLPSLRTAGGQAQRRGLNKGCQAPALPPLSHYSQPAGGGCCDLIQGHSKVAFQGTTLAVITKTPEIWLLRLPGTCGMHYVSNHNSAKVVFK